MSSRGFIFSWRSYKYESYRCFKIEHLSSTQQKLALLYEADTIKYTLSYLVVYLRQSVAACPKNSDSIVAICIHET